MTPDHQSKQKDEIVELQEKLTTQEPLAALGLAWTALQHRLNNTAKLLHPQILKLKTRIGRDDQETVEIVETLERNINYLDNILNRLGLLIPRETKLEQQDVNTLLYEASQELISTRVNNATKDVVVYYQLSDEVPTIKTDTELLTEVFRNLIENSLKAMENAGGELELTTRYLSGATEVEITVKDTGCGIPPDLRDHLFLQPIKKPLTPGAGLGLWLSKLILDRLDGNIQVAHTQVGEGTTVIVTLPLIQ